MAERERLYRTEAVVLRARDYHEADRILTLLTPEGKVSALARGVRRLTSRKAGHLGSFVRVRLLLARGRNLDIITQAECLEAHAELGRDLTRFAYACYAGELVDRLSQEEETRALYDLLVSALRWFARERDLPLWARYLELRLLAYAGYQPELFRCVACGRELQPDANRFSAQEGGLLCPRCGEEASGAQALSLNAQKVLRYMARNDARAVAGLRLSPGTHAELETVLRSYMEYTLERQVASFAFLLRIRRELPPQPASEPG